MIKITGTTTAGPRTAYTHLHHDDTLDAAILRGLDPTRGKLIFDSTDFENYTEQLGTVGLYPSSVLVTRVMRKAITTGGPMNVLDYGAGETRNPQSVQFIHIESVFVDRRTAEDTIRERLLKTLDEDDEDDADDHV